MRGRQYLNIRPGEKIQCDKLLDGGVSLKAARPTGTINRFLGLLAGKNKKIATIDKIDDAAASGWAGKK